MFRSRSEIRPMPQKLDHPQEVRIDCEYTQRSQSKYVFCIQGAFTHKNESVARFQQAGFCSVWGANRQACQFWKVPHHCDVACVVKKQVLFVRLVAKTVLIRQRIFSFFVAPIASVHAFSDAAMNELRERKKVTNLFYPLSRSLFIYLFTLLFTLFSTRSFSLLLTLRFCDTDKYIFGTPCCSCVTV